MNRVSPGRAPTAPNQTNIKKKLKKKPMSRVVPRTGTNWPPKNKRLPMSV